MAFTIACKIIAFIAILDGISSTPICKTRNEKDVICRAGEENYTLRRGLVSDSNKTTGVTLRNCKITKIELESFENLHSLKYIDISRNKISDLPLGVLDGIRQVTYLNVSFNVLDGFHLGVFDQLPNLEVLDLKGNKIANIELGVFDPLIKLRHLDLSSNMLKGEHLNPYIFDQSKKILFLDFSQNDMTDTPNNLLHSLENLDLLNLDECSLKSVPAFVNVANISKLRHLIISRNHIELIEKTDIDELSELEILDLTGNQLMNIGDDAFKFSKKLKQIFLRYNKLTSLQETMFQSVHTLNTVDLSHNLIHYLPVNAFRGTKIRNLNVSDNRFTYLQDNFCLELRNSGVMLSKFYFNQNPWQCACLNDLLSELKIYSISYNDAKYKGKDPVCVTTSDFSCKRQIEFNDVYSKMYYDNFPAD